MDEEATCVYCKQPVNNHACNCWNPEVDLEAQRMRRENEEAMTRVREYIEQHRGATLGLGIFAELFSQCGKN